MFKNKIVLFSGVIIIVIWFISYIKSDNVFYKKIIQSQNLTSPLQVYNWTINNYTVPHGEKVIANETPRYLIENQTWLYCDEAATVMATFDHILGYKTRLIDLYGYDNVSHHTILEVFENNRWVTYDFTKRIYNTPYVKSSGDSFKLKQGKVKPYPKMYNAVINNNSILKYIALKLRGIKQ